MHADHNRVVLKIAKGKILPGEVSLGEDLEEAGLQDGHPLEFLVEDGNAHFLQHAPGRKVVHYWTQLLVGKFQILFIQDLLGEGAFWSGPEEDEDQKERRSTHGEGAGA